MKNTPIETESSKKKNRNNVDSRGKKRHLDILYFISVVGAIHFIPNFYWWRKECAHSHGKHKGILNRHLQKAVEQAITKRWEWQWPCIKMQTEEGTKRKQKERAKNKELIWRNKNQYGIIPFPLPCYRQLKHQFFTWLKL